jgi:hypothetical protein
MLKVIVEKPAIPILFIDTFFFIDLVGNRHKDKKSSHFADELELADLITSLTKQKKLLCPVGDQEEEYELGVKYEDEIREEQTRLALGISAHYHYGLYKYQTQLAIKAYLDNCKEVIYSSRALFQNDPVKELERQLQSRFIVSVHIPTPADNLEKRRKTKKELAQQFEEMRQDKIKRDVKFEDWARHEALGTMEASLTTLKSVLPKQLMQQDLSEEDWNGLLELGDILSYLTHYSGKEASFEDAIKFLKSEYFMSIPYISVQSKLYASMWIQSGKIKDSDNFDFQQASQMLPYSTYYLTDSSLKHRLTTSPLKLDEAYNVKIYSMKEIKALISELKKL